MNQIHTVIRPHYYTAENEVALDGIWDFETGESDDVRDSCRKSLAVSTCVSCMAKQKCSTTFKPENVLDGPSALRMGSTDKYINTFAYTDVIIARHLVEQFTNT